MATGKKRNPMMMSFFMAGLSMQERDIEVRSVDAGVAARASASGLEAQTTVGHVISDGIHMALQAEEAFFAAHQQHAVDASVWRVAGDATLDLRGGMFKDKWSAFFDVAADASLRAA